MKILPADAENLKTSRESQVESLHTPTTEMPALPEKLRLIRTHSDEATRRQLLELVTHDHNTFGYEEGMFFCAEDGSLRARIAQACVDRYNSHAADKAKIKALVEAFEADGDCIDQLWQALNCVMQVATFNSQKSLAAVPVARRALATIENLRALRQEARAALATA